MKPADAPDGRPTDNGPGSSVEHELAEVFGAPVELFARNISAPTNPLEAARRVAHETKPLDVRALAEVPWGKWCDHLREVGIDDAVITDFTYRTTMSLDPLTGRPRCEVDGHLMLLWTRVRELPEGLSVGGDLNLSGTDIAALAEGLRVDRNLLLQATPITSLPGALHVGGFLDLRGTPITSLTEGLRVGGNLLLQRTPITSLPGDLHVGGGLELTGTPITQLPEGLSVGGNLYLSETEITELPEGLSVGHDLYLARTPITQLPGDLSVVGKIRVSESSHLFQDAESWNKAHGKTP